MFNAKKVKDELIDWIKLWFENNGKDCNAVIGISGGLDSSTVAALCVEALGKDRVFGVLMPCGEQSDIDCSLNLVKHLDIEYCISNIFDAVKAIDDQMPSHIEVSTQTRINLPARIRMCMLYAVSQSMNGRVINTCNLSETYVGYDTRWGDSCGDMSPLADLTKTEVRMIAKELRLPNELVNKIPQDGLSGKSDEESFGFTYEVLDKYLREGIIDDVEVQQKIEERHNANLFKLQPIPKFPYEDIF